MVLLDKYTVRFETLTDFTSFRTKPQQTVFPPEGWWCRRRSGGSLRRCAFFDAASWAPTKDSSRTTDELRTYHTARCSTSPWILLPKHQQHHYYYYYYRYYFFRSLAQSCRLNIVLSKVWLQRRLIGVKRVEEGDRISTRRGAIDNCWNRKVDSLGSPVINVACLLISWTSSTAQWFQVPPVSMATG